jgi:protoporphyrinogen oxidase
LGVICVLLVLRRSLSPYYVINLLDKDLPFTGIIESTNVIPSKNFGDRHLVYLPKYVMLNDPLYNTSDDKIIKGFIEYLKKIFFDLRDENILHCHVFRERFVQPIHNPQSLAQLSNYRTPLPKVYLANSSLIKDSTLNNNAVQHIALDAIQTIVADRRMD